MEGEREREKDGRRERNRERRREIYILEGSVLS